MVAFRRWFFALAVVILLAGLASAQTSNTPFTCSAAVSVPPTLRAEGFTEQIGDIVLTCTGGNNGQYTVGTGVPLPTANVTVSLGVNVTSRLINNSVSEALLLIDEPGSGLPPVVPGSGPAAPQTVCSSASAGAGAGGCPQYAQVVNGIAVMSSSSTGVTNPANVYQGLWNSFAPGQIQFLGIPILPAVSSGVTRIYRITNIRANMTGFSGAAFAGTQQVAASVSISSASSVTLNNPVQIAGFVQTSLTVALRNVNQTGGISTTALAQCGSESSVTAQGLLQYSENFGTAFKVRNSIVSSTGAVTYTQGATLAQNIPGVIYNSESGFELSTSNGTTGLADFGTRLQAAFHNIPSGIRMFVSVNNVTNTSIGYGATGGPVNLATLVATGPYPASGALDSSSTVSAGSLAGYPVIAPTTTAGGIPLVEIIPDSTGSAYAVWESIINNPAALDTYYFAFYQLYSSTAGINTPTIPAGASSVTALVNMSYAPIPPGGSSSTTLTAWATASSTLNIPRFTDTSGGGLNAYSVAICETVLLFPFITNTNGFDTGIAISNTTTDPLGTKTQQGVCQLYAYGTNAPTSQPACTSSSTTTGQFCMPGIGSTATTGYVVSSGYTSATLASSIAPGFQGYIIAICQFELAHGFAFVSDVGARNLAMGYLALVLGTPSSNGVGSNRNGINEVAAH